MGLSQADMTSHCLSITSQKDQSQKSPETFKS